jgi:hypothetical protein
MGWGKDTAGKMDSLNKKTDGDTEEFENEKLNERAKVFSKVDKEYVGEFIGRICSPVFMQDKILPPQVPMRVILKRSEDSFALMHETGEFTLSIVDPVLIVRKVAVSPTVRETYIKISEEGTPFRYYLNTPTVNYYSIQQNSTQFMRDDLFMGKLPRRVIIGMASFICVKFIHEIIVTIIFNSLFSG